MNPTQAGAYALGVVGIQPLDDSASGPVQDGADTRTIVDSLATMKDILLVVDETRPELGIKAELDRLGGLIADDKLSEFAAAFRVLIEKAKPYFPKE